MNVAKTQLQTTAKMIIEGIMSESPQTLTGRNGTHYMNQWDWYQGVALFGMYTYYRKTGDTSIRDYLVKWFKDRIAEGLPEQNINTMCPLLTLSYLYEEMGEQWMMDTCREWLEYPLNELPRTVEGGYQHKTIDSLNEGQLWDDTLYMTVLFVARMGVLLNREDCIQESIRQFLVHIKYLTDMKTGLLYHGWTFIGCHHFGEALWGRGNAWYTAGLVDYLDIAPVNDGVKDFLLSALNRQVEALAKYQDEEGMWHTLINLPESSYQESSATAGFSYGILKAARLGYIDRSYAEMGLKGLNAILARIDGEGIVQQVSAGTCVGADLDYYRTIPVCSQPYGQSMALLLLLEAMNWVD